MKSRVLAGAMLAVCSASLALAESGVPSSGKLSKLGLGAMQVVGDEQGMQVRGSGGQFVKLGLNWQTTAGEKATIINGQLVLLNPPNFAVNDSNRGSAIATDGGGVKDGIAVPQVVNFQSDAVHQQDIIFNSFFASEISASRTIASVLAGNAKLLGINSIKP